MEEAGARHEVHQHQQAERGPEQAASGEAEGEICAVSHKMVMVTAFITMSQSQEIEEGKLDSDDELNIYSFLVQKSF